MVTDEEFLSKEWPQNCGDSLRILRKSTQQQNKQYLWECEFVKYSYKILALKGNILKGKVTNPEIERIEFIEKLWLQNCGDSLRIIQKTNQKQSSAHYLWEVEFVKYPYRTLATKGNILTGQVENPRVEIEEFVKVKWPQSCGDILEIIEKTTKKKDDSYLWKARFSNHPYEILAIKRDIIRGSILNPQIEIDEFISKEWPQNCGDTLKIIEKTNKKRSGSDNYLWKCQFIEYPCEVFVVKREVIVGSVNNPQIEIIEFANKEWLQNCGDTLKIIEKTNKKQGKVFLWRCQFQKYPCEVLALKSSIIQGIIDNPALPWKSKEKLEKYIKENYTQKIPLVKLAEDLNISASYASQLINKYQLRENIQYDFGIQEQRIKDFIKSLGFECITKIFSKELNYNELDCYIPNKNFGIEFNGNYWHSEKYRERDYHQQKSLLFKEKANINLFHIFEYEWWEKEEILKSIIRSKLGIFDKKVGARQCEIKELSNKEYQDFCNQNHLQGEAGAKIKLGLIYKNELVQILSLSLPRFTDKFDWEIIRECSKQGWLIVGGKQKLWNYFANKWNPNNCISYCDFGKFEGNSYLKLGFKKLQLNKPGFMWYDNKNHQIFWRNPYKNQELKDKGYLKIFDAGQLVFVWQKEG